MSVEAHRALDGQVYYTADPIRPTKDQIARWEAEEERHWLARREFRAKFLVAIRLVELRRGIDL